ncbi:hypothetical protein NQ318_022572 [Aromia moschata]|uniref:Proton-coupled folate transporter n=1 Tax=Aromia moschata TaxID=1265417 RepID=A0AAV8XVA9_9CUCU|nr:hypothetical protein NQ318_022572 [Aromia moschata]
MSLEKSKSLEAGLQSIALDAEEPPKLKKLSFRQKAKIILTDITVEPIMICYVLPSVMASIATQNLTLEKACRVNLRFPEDVCDALSIRNESYPGYKESEEAVQRLSAYVAIFKNVIQSALPSALLLFLGSWSDRHKRRKPCIINPVLGDIAMILCFALCTYFFYELPMELNAISESLPPALTGGWFAMFMGTFTYISGVTSEETRTIRIGAVNMFMNVSLCVGIALSGVCYEKLGFYGVYALALAIYSVGLVYGIFFVKDIDEIERERGVVVENRKGNGKSFLKDFFDTKYVVETFRVAFKKGERNRRARVCMIMILVMVIIGPMHGEMNVYYYFVRYKYGWDSIDYSIFSTFQFVTHTIGTLFSLAFFTNFLKVDDAILGIISNSSKILAAFIYAFAPTPLIFYAGAVAEMLNGTSFIAMRAIVSKLVPPEELGQINSLFGVAEAIVPLVYGPLYSKIYAATIEFFPGAFFLAGGILTTPSIFVFFWLYLEHKKDRNAEILQKSQEEKPLKGEKETNVDNA